MKDRIIPAPPELFCSPLLRPAAVLYCFAALLGLGATGALLLPDSLKVLTEDLVSSGITDRSGIQTWTVIHVVLILSGWVCAMCMAAGLILEGRQKGKGLAFLHNAAQWLLRAVNTGGIVVLCIMIWRMAAYLWSCIWVDAGIYLAYVMLIPEGVMISLSVGVFVLIRRFLNSCCDGAASMSYARLCGNLDSYTIPGFCSTGFLLISAVDVYFALERLLTVTIIEDFDGDYYWVLIAEHPVLLLTSGMFVCGASANFLIGLYLKKYKREAEWLVFRSMRQTLEQS